MGGFRRALLGCASLYALYGGVGVQAAQAGAPAPLSPAWFAQRGTAINGRVGGNAASPVMGNGLGVSPLALQKVQQSVADVTQAAKAIVAAQARQSQARALALVSPSARVPDGLTLGGLRPAAGAIAGSALWQGANLPTQAVAASHTTVTVKQTSAQAVLTWQSFNVGQNTTLNFDQSAGGAVASTWVALNRVNDPTAQPSQILGQITALGQVYVINRNGIIFGGASQVNVNALVASTADIDTAQFLKTGIYSTQVGNTLLPSFTGASAASQVIVEGGASITTSPPTSVVQAGGFVFLMGGQVQNAGAIDTPDGQIAMAAGTDFILRPGYSVSSAATAPSTSTTRGTEIAVATGGGAVFNSGVLQATTGDITLVGHSVIQSGVAVSTSSVAQRGTIHLLTDMSDPSSSVVLAPGSLTLIQPDDGGVSPALDVQRSTSIAASGAANNQRLIGSATNPPLNNQAALPDQLYQSRIEITSGGLVDFKGGSLTAASGGQVAVSSGAVTKQPGDTDRILVEANAVIDVAGLLNVSLPMSANQVEVNIQGFEQRDAPVNRDTTILNNSNVFVDERQLVSVPASAADPTNRLYTAGGLLEVSGEVGNVGHSIQEWSTLGGTVAFSGTTVATQPGSIVNIAGGSITYQAGMLQNSYLKGIDGNVYNVNAAPANLQYTGIYNGFTTDHPRWGVSDTFTGTIVDPSQSFEAAYTVGRDAGTLLISASTAILEGTVDAGVITGSTQTALRATAFQATTPVINTPYLLVNTPSLLAVLRSDTTTETTSPILIQAASADDPFQLPQDVRPLGGALLIGSYNSLGLAGPGPRTAVIADGTVPADTVISPTQIAASGLASLSVTASQSIGVRAPLDLAPGGQVTLTAPNVAIDASITARAAIVTAGNFFESSTGGNAGQTVALTYADPLAVVTGNTETAAVSVGTTATIDVRGLWTNALLAPDDAPGQALVDGGNVILQSTGPLALTSGSVVDASSGGAILASGKPLGGMGGNITLVSGATAGTPSKDGITLLGTLRDTGVNGGGSLTVQTPEIIIGVPVTHVAPGQPITGLTPVVPGVLLLAPSFFQQGFSAYNLTGYGTLTDGAGNPLPGVIVTPGTDIEVNEPVYQFTNASVLAPSGTAPASALMTYLPPVYLGNPVTAKVTQRAGASVVLSSAYGGPLPNGSTYGAATTNAFAVPNLAGPAAGDKAIEVAGGGAVSIGKGATLRVDPGQSILLQGFGQVTVDGRLAAPGGMISVLGTTKPALGADVATYVPGQSVWIGGDATLDVAAQAFVTQDLFGRPYGIVPDGGSIVLGASAVGGSSTGATTLVSTADPVIIRPGAVLDASGTSAVIDPLAGTAVPLGGVQAKLDATAPSAPILVASAGGAISLSSYSGIFIDGVLRAASGGPGASGGTLSITLETPDFNATSGDLSSIVDPLRVAHELLIEPQTTKSLLPAGLKPGDVEPFAATPALLGTARIGADQIAAGGFDNVSLFSRDLILFDGSVKLAAGRSISLVSGEIADTGSTASVVVSAPYILLGSAGPPDAPPGLHQDTQTSLYLTGAGNVTSGGLNLAIAVGTPFSLDYAPCLGQGAGACSSASLSFQADLIDIQGLTHFGVDSTITLNTPANGDPTPTIHVDEPGFNDVSFVSTGDIRLDATITSAGNLSFTAAQIYPDTGTGGGAVAGLNVTTPNTPGFYPAARLTINGNGTVPAAPLSVNGILALSAPTIIQGGILRAPLGTITLGQFGNPPVSGFNDTTKTVQLLPGSITSVSAAGLTVPYGGTTDGITYSYNGTQVSSSGLLPNAGIGGTIILAGQTVQVAKGATLDLSGGGVLAGGGGESISAVDGSFVGQGFISGRGGSTDTLYTPFVTFNPSSHSISAPAVQTASNPGGTAVYAIVPGIGPYAPATSFDEASSYAGSVPKVGSQITIPAGVPGLKPGTYTLLPSYYALLAGGYRVEIDTSTAALVNGANPLRNGSYQVNAVTSVANTAIRSPLPVVATFTSGPVLRTYSQYDEETFSSFATTLAAQNGSNRPFLPQDAKTLLLSLTPPPQPSTADFPAHTGFTFDGTALFQPAPGGYGGTVALGSTAPIEITDAPTPTIGFTGVSVAASQLDALGASRLMVGGYLDSGGSFTGLPQLPSAVTLHDGAVLRAPEVILIGAITLEPGAVVDTVGTGPAPFGPDVNVIYSNLGTSESNVGVLAVSNGNLQFTAPFGGDPIRFGICATGDVCSPTDVARIDSEGSINFVTAGSLSVGKTVRFGSANINFSVASANIGSDAALASANVPTGLQLTQATLATLLAGDPASGAPPLQSLGLTASQSINFYGTVSIDTIDPATGQSSLGQVVLSTPAIYGFGGPDDVATLRTGNLVWTGLAVPASEGSSTLVAVPTIPPVAGGPGTGSGTLNIEAQQIVIGYSPQAQALAPGQNGAAQSLVPLSRTLLGFGNVDLTASESITTNAANSLLVYQAQGPYQNGTGFTHTGGNLVITTPLLTGAKASTLAITAGGGLTVQAPASGPGAAAAGGLGAEIDLTGTTVSLDTTVALPSGKLAVTGVSGDVVLGAGTMISLAGPAVPLLDQTVFSPGGTLLLTSASGNVTVAPGSTIDVSAPGANAGSVTATAAAGNVTLGGALLGAGGTAGGTITITTGTMSQAAFDALNSQLNANGFTAARSFDVKSGDLAIGAVPVRASSTTVSVDGGALVVDGLVDASGATPGAIRLSAANGLTLTSDAVLDAHSTVLQVDSSGQPIDASNTPHITLTSSAGVLQLTPGATFDLRSADGVARGDLELNVPRANDVGIVAAGPLTIRGAASVALNVFQTYVPGQEGLLQGGVITQADIDAIGAESTTFIDAALSDTALQGRIAGLSTLGADFHLRPGVEIDSSAASGGNLFVGGDLDLSGQRYHSTNAANDITSVYGSGEPGVLVLRASANLNINGSITDGFGLPPATPDDNGWVLSKTLTTAFVVPPTLPAGTALVGGTANSATRFSTTGGALNFDALLTPTSSNPLTLVAGATIPAVPASSAPVSLAASSTIATAFIATGSIKTPAGLSFTVGQTVPAGTVLPQGTVLGAGLSLPVSVTINAVTWPAGADLAAFAKPVNLASNLTLQPGDVLPAGSTLSFTGGSSTLPTRPSTIVDDADGKPVEGRIWAVAPLLPASTQSWSIQLVAGADLGAADSRVVRTAPALAGQATAMDPAPGSIILSDPHFMNATALSIEGTQAVESVIRTGTGSLSLVAGGNISEDSLFGIYTAGHQAADVAPAYNLPQAAPPGGASALGASGSSVTLNGATYDTALQGYQAYYPTGGGDVLVSAQGTLGGYVVQGGVQLGGTILATPDSNEIGNWLYRQGGNGVSPSYWINFGTYVPATQGLIYQAGFTGIGALGGGNVDVAAGGNAGATSSGSTVGAPSRGIDVAVGSTGRVLADGSIERTGGGTVTLQVGGALNPVSSAVNTDSPRAPADLFGTLTDLRGNIVVTAGSVGAAFTSFNINDPITTNSLLALNTTTSPSFKALGGPVIVLGDGSASLSARGDLVISGVGDPTRETQFNIPTVGAAPGETQSTEFSLWTPATAISLYSAGGNVIPIVGPESNVAGSNATALDFRYVYPPNLTVVAAQGNIMIQTTAVAGVALPPTSLELAPAPNGQLELLAGGSILDKGTAVDISGADPQTLSSPTNPAFTVLQGSAVGTTNTVPTGTGSLFAFGPDTPTTNLHGNDSQPARIYAATGDIIGLQTGEVLTFAAPSTQAPSFIAGKAVQIEAGQTIAFLGELPGTSALTPQPGVSSTGSLVLNSNPTDVSIVSAGRNIISANQQIAGPGNLLVQAGANINQGQQGVLESIGPLVDVNALTRAGGAGITMLAGVGATGPDYTGFAKLYLDPANLANAATPLQQQPGKVVQTYGDQLLTFLDTQEGYTGTADGALAFFQALPAATRALFLLPIYFDELNQSGLEFNDPTSRFSKSYIRGNDAIATLFPGNFAGDITQFGASGIRTDFGGGITVVAPGGQVTLGVASNAAPPSKSGLITQGSGDINIYSQGSVELGQSRIFTTFGGGIVIWSSHGDIAAGQGSKSTVVFTPPNITYDGYGNITLSPTVPSTGAGIATLAPIASVPPGDINLVAPLGVIDAGEAGIRASGNANLAALAVVNAANIQVQGKTTGLPVIAVPNISALTAASSANAGAFQGALANQAAGQARAQQPSIITVEVLGYGGSE